MFRVCCYVYVWELVLLWCWKTFVENVGAEYLDQVPGWSVFSHAWRTFFNFSLHVWGAAAPSPCLIYSNGAHSIHRESSHYAVSIHKLVPTEGVFTAPGPVLEADLLPLETKQPGRTERNNGRYFWRFCSVLHLIVSAAAVSQDSVYVQGNLLLNFFSILEPTFPSAGCNFYPCLPVITFPVLVSDISTLQQAISA